MGSEDYWQDKRLTNYLCCAINDICHHAKHRSQDLPTVGDGKTVAFETAYALIVEHGFTLSVDNPPIAQDLVCGRTMAVKTAKRSHGGQRHRDISSGVSGFMDANSGSDNIGGSWNSI